jgi:hypothetical protein
MKKLWNDLLNEPVLSFTVISTGMVAANGVVESVALNVATVMAVAIGGVITRHYVTPTRKL